MTLQWPVEKTITMDQDHPWMSRCLDDDLFLLNDFYTQSLSAVTRTYAFTTQRDFIVKKFIVYKIHCL